MADESCLFSEYSLQSKAKQSVTGSTSNDYSYGRKLALAIDEEEETEMRI
jgi:hypothetical protein